MAEGEEEDESSKTEEPTPKKLEEALKQGNVVNSREVTTFMMVLTLALIVYWILPYSCKNSVFFLRGFIENAHNIDISGDNLINVVKVTLKKMFLYIVLPLAATMVMAIMSSFVQTGQFNISFEPIMPKLSKISPISGFKKIFSMRSLVEFIKGIIKLAIVAFIVYLSLMSDIRDMVIYPQFDVGEIIYKIQQVVNHIMLYVCIFLAIIAVADYTYQRFEYMKSLRMTKEEVKEEFKQAEGSPEIKKKMKSIRLERAQNRMMQDVPDADVVITNPTHYSIALQYKPEEMNAPVLVAKGVDHIALKIREIANDNEVPLVENKPLARALYDNVEIGDEVPAEHYETIAEIISYVYKLNGKKI